MADVISDNGLAYKLQSLVNQFIADGLEVHLYQNNYVPVLGMVLGDFTECTFDGYAPLNMVPWSTPLVTSHVANSTMPGVQFANIDGSIPNSIYGYYVTDSTSTVLLWAGLYVGGPFVINTAGQTFTVVINMADQNT